MEFVEGHSLAHYLAHKVRFTDEDIPGLMSQVLDALHHAHEQGVWHRDIKPANIILGRSGRLKIADFGVARIENSGLTQMHTLIGTPAYMAPEQFRGDTIDRRVDLYSAGVLLYTLLTGQPPFSGSTEALMYKVVHEEPPLPSKVAGAMRPMFYDTLVATALAKDPARRFGTADEFKAAIARGVGEPIVAHAWEQTVMRSRVPEVRKPGAGPVPGAASLGSQGSQGAHVSQGSAPSHPTHWERSQLSTVEHSLAKYLGPMATVLVRRAARDCHDLPTLYAQLAAHVTNPSARAEFLGHASGPGTKVGAQTQLGGSGTRSAAAAGSAGSAGSGVGAAAAPLSAATLDGARKLLAVHLGPIAGVMVKKASEKAPVRPAFFAALADAVPAAARAQLLADLAKLP
jgi:serine/threonine-protein kinase